MNKAELDSFLIGERTCRVATASPRGPHLTALWYVWDGTALWLTSVVGSQRWTDLEDRKVKNRFRDWEREGRATTLTKRPLRPTEDEVRANPAARSAKLRAVEMN